MQAAFALLCPLHGQRKFDSKLSLSSHLGRHSLRGAAPVSQLYCNPNACGCNFRKIREGTAELVLSKPVRWSDYFTGKFLGGYILFLAILVLDIFLSVSSAFTFFGPQDSLGILPGLFLTQAIAALVFCSLAFMLGELIRRSSLACIFSSTIFFSSFIIGEFLGLI
jgi:hypothetical protein